MSGLMQAPCRFQRVPSQCVSKTNVGGYDDSQKRASLPAKGIASAAGKMYIIQGQ